MNYDQSLQQRREGSSMRALCVLLALSVGIALGTGCAQSPTGPGVIYMNVKGPMDPYSGTSTVKRGEACQRIFLALFAWGDASVETAKRNAKISEVTTIDYESFNIVGFGSFCTIVWGS